MIDQDGFDFRRADTFSGNFNRVVRAPDDVPQTVLIDHRPIAVYPNIGKTRPISLYVTLRVVPKSSRHADPRLAHDKLSDPLAHGPTFIVDHIGGHSGQRPGKGTRLDGRENIAHDDSARDFGPARIVN